MAQFSVNPERFDPYKNFKFRIKWDGKYVAGVSKIGALKRTTEIVEHREGGLDIGHDPFALIVTGDDENVGALLTESLSQLGNPPPATIEPLGFDRERDLLSKILGVAQAHELVETVSLAPKVMLRLALVPLVTQAPLLGRRDEQRAVRDAEAEYDFGHYGETARRGLTFSSLNSLIAFS